MTNLRFTGLKMIVGDIAPQARLIVRQGSRPPFLIMLRGGHQCPVRVLQARHESNEIMARKLVSWLRG